MSGFYRLDEARFLAIQTAVSAANALSVRVGPVPTNKVWTILSGVMYPSADDNTLYWFSILDRSGFTNPIVRPVTFQTNIAVGQYFPLLTEGTEVALFPGEYLYAHRAVAAAGSTLSIIARVIESELSLQKYIDPQEGRKYRSGWLRRSPGSGGGGGGGGGGEGEGPGGGLGPGEGLPVL